MLAPVMMRNQATMVSRRFGNAMMRIPAMRKKMPVLRENENSELGDWNWNMKLLMIDFSISFFVDVGEWSLMDDLELASSGTGSSPFLPINFMKYFWYQQKPRTPHRPAIAINLAI